MTKRRALVRAALLLVLGAALVLLASYAWLRLAPRDVPAGQPELVTLDADSLAPVREAFDAHPNEIRVLALLSPT